MDSLASLVIREASSSAFLRRTSALRSALAAISFIRDLAASSVSYTEVSVFTRLSAWPLAFSSSSLSFLFSLMSFSISTIIMSRKASTSSSLYPLTALVNSLYSISAGVIIFPSKILFCYFSLQSKGTARSISSRCWPPAL